METSLFETLRADRVANRGNPKGLLVVSAFRLAQRLAAGGSRRLWALPGIVAYRLVVDWTMGIEIPPSVQAGPGLCVWHGTGLVVHKDVRLGSEVMLRHGVTLGTIGDGDEGLAPTIGDRVSVGAGAIILGPIHIGDDAVIGAGAVVITDVPAGATAVGNPARVLPRGPARNGSADTAGATAEN